MSETEARDSDDATRTHDAVERSPATPDRPPSPGRDPGRTRPTRPSPAGGTARTRRSPVWSASSPASPTSSSCPGVYAALLGLLRQRHHRPAAVPAGARRPRRPARAAGPAQDAAVRAVHVPRHRQHGPRGRGDRRPGHLGDDPDSTADRCRISQGLHSRDLERRAAPAPYSSSTPSRRIPMKIPALAGRRRRRPLLTLSACGAQQHHRTGRRAARAAAGTRPPRGLHVASTSLGRVLVDAIGPHRLPADRRQPRTRRRASSSCLQYWPAVAPGHGHTGVTAKVGSTATPPAADDRDRRRAAGLHVLAGPRRPATSTARACRSSAAPGTPSRPAGASRCSRAAVRPRARAELGAAVRRRGY